MSCFSTRYTDFAVVVDERHNLLFKKSHRSSPGPRHDIRRNAAWGNSRFHIDAIVWLTHLRYKSFDVSSYLIIMEICGFPAN